jgi:hypothetical protein
MYNFTGMYPLVFPRRYLYFGLVLRLLFSSDPDRYTDGSLATVRVSRAGQVTGDDPQEN